MPLDTGQLWSFSSFSYSFLCWLWWYSDCAYSDRDIPTLPCLFKSSIDLHQPFWPIVISLAETHAYPEGKSYGSNLVWRELGNMFAIFVASCGMNDERVIDGMVHGRFFKPDFGFNPYLLQSWLISFWHYVRLLNANQHAIYMPWWSFWPRVSQGSGVPRSTPVCATDHSTAFDRVLNMLLHTLLVSVPWWLRIRKKAGRWWKQGHAIRVTNLSSFHGGCLYLRGFSNPVDLIFVVIQF